jgi:HEAT repeat protein
MQCRSSDSLLAITTVGNSRDRQFFTQAQAAAAEANWSQVTYYLQEFFESGEASLLGLGTEGKLLATELDPVLNLCLQVLENGDYSDRWNLVKIVPKLGEGVLDSLIAIIRHTSDSDVRWFAMRIMGEFRHPIVIEILFESLFSIEDLNWSDDDEDKDPESEEWQSLAVDIMTKFGTQAIAPLSELITDEQTRFFAVISLSRIASEEVVTPLLQVVNDPHPEIREIAIKVLGLYPDLRIPSVLIQALQDEEYGIRTEAVNGLGWRQSLRKSHALVEHLTPMLTDRNLFVSCQAATALGRLGSFKAVKALWETIILTHTSLLLRQKCLQALGQISTPTSLKYLGKCLELRDREIYLETISVLGSLQPPVANDAMEILVDFLTSYPLYVEHFELECAFAQALGQLRAASAIEPLIQLLERPDLKTRLHIVAALKNINSQQAQQQLTELAGQTNLSPELQAGIAIALREWSNSDAWQTINDKSTGMRQQK